MIPEAACLLYRHIHLFFRCLFSTFDIDHLVPSAPFQSSKAPDSRNRAQQKRYARANHQVSPGPARAPRVYCAADLAHNEAHKGPSGSRCLWRDTYPADGLSRSSVTGRFLSSGDTSSPSCSRSSRPSCSSCPSCPSCCSCSCSYSCCYSRVETVPAVAPCYPRTALPLDAADRL